MQELSGDGVCGEMRRRAGEMHVGAPAAPSVADRSRTRLAHEAEVNDGVDVYSASIMAAKLVVRYMDIPGFERVPATKYSVPEQYPALVEDACARLDAVSPTLSSVLRRCCSISAMDVKTSTLKALALKALVGGGVGGGSGGGGSGGAFSFFPTPAPQGAAATLATPAAPALSLATQPAVVQVPVQLIDMGDAADAVAALHVPTDVLERMCEAMTAVADGVGNVTGAQLLRIAVDEGMGAVAAVALRRKLSIVAAVPPRKVRSVGVVTEVVAAGVAWIGGDVFAVTS